MSNNTKKSPEDNEDQIETKNSKKGNEVNTTKIFNEYIENRLDSNPSFFSNGLNYSDFLNFIGEKYENNKDEFENNKPKYLKLLLREVIVYNTKYKNIFDNVFSSFENDFDLDSKKQTKLKDILSSQDNISLKKLLYSNKKRVDFLKHHLGITDISFKEDQERIEKILPKTFEEIKDNKEAISSILSFIDRRTKVEIDDLENILNILKNSKQKIEFISFFIPSISLEEAVKNGFLSKIDTEKRREDIIQKYAGQTCDDECIKDISKTIEYKDIYIDTFELDRDNQDISITPAVLQNITEQINEGKEQLSNEAKIIDTYEADEFIHFIKKDTSLSQVLYNFQNIKNGNFFKIVTGEGSGSTLQYFRFDEVKSGKETSSMDFTNITLSTGVNTRLDDTARKETKTYFAMYELFQKLKSKNAHIVFMNKSDLEKDLQKEGKTEVPDEGNINSKEDLKKFFDEVDPKGKELGIDNIAFKFDIIGDNKKKKGEELYIIEEIDEKAKTITLHSGEKLGFDRFAELFKQAKAKRIQKVSSPKEFIEKLSHKNENFKDIIFKDDKIIPKDKENDNKYKSIQYFIGEKGEESIFIKNMGDNRIDFVIGKYSEGVKGKDGKVGKDTFKGDKKGTGWTYTEFFDMIKDKKLSPKIFDDETNNEEEKVKDVSGRKGSIFSAWIGGFVSISQIVTGASQAIENVKKYLERGDKLKSQQMTAAFAKYIPMGSVRDEIQSRLEKEEKSTMEELREVLTTLDSAVMMPRVEKILLDTNAPMYEREARMFACLKYGTIYPKTLSKYRGSYAWFKAMGGNIKNIPYYKKEILKDDPNLVITEEDLITYLFKLQAKGDQPPKRRSKIHKEFAKAIGGGISDEMGDGEGEAGKKMTQQGRINYVMGEIHNGTYYNGIGGIEKVWAKGPDPAYKMFEVPFVLLSTKTTLNLNQEIINKLVGYAFGNAHTPLVFSKSNGDLEMYKDYIKRIIELQFGDKMLSAFKSIGNNTKKAQDFWNKHGDDLYPYINMNNSFVLSRKDEPGNEILKTYYEKIKGVHSSDDFKNGKLNDDIEGGAFDFENSPIFATKGLLEKVSARDRGYIDKQTAKILATYTDYINSLKNDESVLNEEKRKELFKEYYRLVERVVYGKLSPHKSTNSPQGWYKNFEISKALETKGVEIYDGPEGRGYDDFLDKKYEDFIGGAHIQDDIEGITNETYRKIDDILK